MLIRYTFAWVVTLNIISSCSYFQHYRLAILGVGQYKYPASMRAQEMCSIMCSYGRYYSFMFIFTIRLWFTSLTHCQHQLHKFTTHIITARHKKILYYVLLVIPVMELRHISPTEFTHWSKETGDKNFYGIRDATPRRISSMRQPHSHPSLHTVTQWRSGAHSFIRRRRVERNQASTLHTSHNVFIIIIIISIL